MAIVGQQHLLKEVNSIFLLSFFVALVTLHIKVLCWLVSVCLSVIGTSYRLQLLCHLALYRYREGGTTDVIRRLYHSCSYMATVNYSDDTGTLQSTLFLPFLSSMHASVVRHNLLKYMYTVY